MVTKRVLVAAVLSTFCLTATLFMVVPTKSQTGYDPWTDVNDDGSIDMADLQLAIDSFMAAGDPTKSVNVANWPEKADVTVWYQQSLANGALITSPMYYADGYSTLHIIMVVGDLAYGESVYFVVEAPLWDTSHWGYSPIVAYDYSFADTSQFKVVSIDVPSESFYFYFYANPGTTSVLSLSFYLTWA